MHYQNIAALIPFYDPYGQNSTCILLADGQKEYAACSIRNYIARMLYTLHLDPNAVRHWTYGIIGIRDLHQY